MRLSTCLCFSPCKSHATLKPSNHQCFKTTEVTEVYWIILGVAWCGIGDLTWLVTSFRFFAFFFVELKCDTCTILFSQPTCVRVDCRTPFALVPLDAARTDFPSFVIGTIRSSE